MGLFYPDVRDRRWLDRGGVVLTSVVYLFVVVLFAVVVGHGPTPATFALFLAISLVLIGLAGWVPRDLLAPRAGPARVRPWVIALAGSLPFDGWTVLLILSNHPVMPAWAAGLVTVLVDLLALAIVLRYTGTDQPEWTKFYLAAGMLGVLAVWDVIVEFSVPGILVVTAVFLYLLYRLHRTMRSREASPPAGAVEPPPRTA